MASLTLPYFQLGADAMGTWMGTAHPLYYFLYFCAAGVGAPLSEDALVVWVGAHLFRGEYGSWQMGALAVATVYFGVVISDMVSYSAGSLLQRGMFPWLRQQLLSSDTYERAVNTTQKFGKAIGAVQRFFVGFRGPLCLIAGFMEVPAGHFLAGTAIAAVGTMSIQFTVGYLLRDTPNVYLTALALVAGPNLVGHVVGPLLAGLGVFMAGRRQKPNPQQQEQQQQQTGAI